MRERNSKTAPMGGKFSASDLVTIRKLKNTDTTSHLLINQHNNIPSAPQISVVANKEIKKPQYVEKKRLVFSVALHINWLFSLSFDTRSLFAIFLFLFLVVASVVVDPDLVANFVVYAGR